MIIVDKYIRFYGTYDASHNTFWVNKGHEDRFYKMIKNYRDQSLANSNHSGVMGKKHFSGDQELSVSNKIPYMTNKEYRKLKLEKLNTKNQ